MEWKIAKPPLLLATIIVLIVIVVDIVAWQVENKETTEFKMQLMESNNRIEMKLDGINEAINNQTEAILKAIQQNGGQSE